MKYIQIFEGSPYIHKIQVYAKHNSDKKYFRLVGIDDTPSWIKSYTYYVKANEITKLWAVFYL